MKKITILTAVIIAAVAANAASFKWTAANMYSADLTTKFEGTVTLYAYLSSADASTAVAIDTFTTTTAGVINNTFSSDALTANNTYTFFFTVDDSYNGMDYTYTSKSVSVLAQETSTATVGFGTQATTSKTVVGSVGENGWAAVPEPTSGILLLLGMAGLALRRKQK